MRECNRVDSARACERSQESRPSTRPLAQQKSTFEKIERRWRQQRRVHVASAMFWRARARERATDELSKKKRKKVCSQRGAAASATVRRSDFRGRASAEAAAAAVTAAVSVASIRSFLGRVLFAT